MSGGPGRPWPDHFSRQSADYRRYRPRYPQALFAWLASAAPARRTAWDCGTGNGQAAVGLAEHFERVVATDPSANQLAEAEPHAQVEYRSARAEDSGLEPASVDLVTVAQALHWFDLERFYAEVSRVLRPGGLIAVWCYGLMEIDPAVDPVIRHFYEDVVGPYWPPQRAHVESGYRELAFPFAPVAAPCFAMTADWSLEELAGYVATWSPTKIFQEQRGCDPLRDLNEPLSKAWGAAERRRVVWPLHVRAGRR
jgi:ubiquinone/menaquinone biosynthesis C-methylase UbiE